MLAYRSTVHYKQHMSAASLFPVFVTAHIVTGTVGLVAFWGPVALGKGTPLHRRIGEVFVIALLLTGTSALLMSLSTLVAPEATHPQLATHPVFADPQMIRAVFGWLMLGLALLTLNLVWYGWQSARNKRAHALNLEWRTLLLQAVTFLAGLNCAWQGLRIGQPLLLGMTAIGWATVGTNLWFLYKRQPGPVDWLKEHIKALVGAGISVYTAFMAFGAVHTFPALALHPVLWAIPLTVGLILILYHQARVSPPRRRSDPRSA